MEEAYITATPSTRMARVKGDLILLVTAIIWGSAFAAQRVAAQGGGVFLFNGSRFVLGALVLLVFIRFRWKLERSSLRWVVLGGLLLFGASSLQQAGMVYTTAGNAGFITSTYVALVPLMLLVFWRQKIGWNSWVAAAAALAGTLLLSTGGGLELKPGDALEFAGAFLWAGHLILISRIIGKVDVLQFSIGQYLVCGMLNLMVGVMFEGHTLPALVRDWWAIAYTGILSVGLGYTLQAIGQRTAPATDASIILGMEAVFAVVFGAIFLGELLSPVQLSGCGLIFLGIILTQAYGSKTAAEVR